MKWRTLGIGPALLLLAGCGGAGASPSPTITPSTSAAASISEPSTAAQPSVSQPAASPSATSPIVSVAPLTPASPAPQSPAAPPSPVAIAPAGGTALQPNLTITTADQGKSFNVKAGAVIDLDLKADSGMQPWQVQNPDPAILQAIPNPAAAAAQGVTLRSFKAAGAGTATIMATERPQCSPGQACPQFIRAWKVTISVSG